MSINGHKTGIQEANVKIRKEKYIRTSLHPSKKYTHSPYQKCPILTLPLNTRLRSSKTTPPFGHGLPKGEIVRTYVNHVKNIYHLELANTLTKRTLLVFE